MALPERYSERGLASLLVHRATIDPNEPFILHDASRHSFSEVDQEAEALAASLSNMGVEAGERIAVILPPCPEFVVAMLAAAKLGCVLVPLDPHLTEGELRYMLRHSEAVAAVTIETYQGVQYLELFDGLLDQLPELRLLVTVGEEELWYDDQIFQYEDMISAGRGRDYPVRQEEEPDAVFALLYTSGTTGKPKGVLVTHRNLLVAAAGTVQRLGIGRDDRVVGVSSLAHAFGLGPGVVGSLLTGAGLVLHDELEPGVALDLVEAHGGTVAYGTPTFFTQQIREMEVRPRDISSLRTIMMAGSIVLEDGAARAEEVLEARVVVAYSLTEASSTVTVAAPEDEMHRRHDTAGVPIDGVEVRIMEEDTVLPLESVGEVVIRGSTLMQGYYRMPRETSARIDGEGFFRTGDLGMVDEGGCLHLVGRMDDVIIRRGFNVYPREVEDRLHAHPAVLEAALIGLPDDLLGEATCACLILEEGALVTPEEIRDWCRASMAEPKVPDEVRFLDALPYGAAGQLRRGELRRRVRSAS